MNSLEALYKLYKYIMIDNEQGLMYEEEVEAVNKDYNLIKQDLEAYEKLKIENEVIRIRTKDYKRFYDKYKQKSEKLTKVIDLLDNVLDLELENSEEWGKMTYFINSNGGSTLTKETYNFLKEFINEVLE